MPLMVDGELVDDDEVRKLLKLVRDDAIKIAGEFHGMQRSARFRLNWPNEYKFAESEWKTFVAAVRMMYAERLGNPRTPRDEAQMMHRALVVQAMMGASPNASDALQMGKRTQQFEGDKAENRKIDHTYGLAPGTWKERMLRTASRMLH